ncbi:MAG: hypothetical protein KDJ87_13670 [Rhizobiaceae bacterium]|nr:hypothetical protein [Rhizobiaceae bacterium]
MNGFSTNGQVGTSRAPGHGLASWRHLGPDESLTARRFLIFVALAVLATILVQIAFWLATATDYVGKDPDDTMRLVEIRDYLAGQGWFDLGQRRLGPDGGTLMHWSRLVDGPIAGLIGLFGLFLGPRQAEAAALAVWPLLLVLPLMGSTALAAYRLGGKSGMVIGLLLALVFLTAIVRFRPGAIDHHNVQLVLVAFIAAMLIDPLARLSNFAAAAVAGGAALAIGAETTPLVAMAAMSVAILWALRGADYRGAAIGFGLAFAAATGAIFLATTPPQLWGSVTCDTLSLGYLAPSALGGLMLAGSAAGLTGRSMPVRFGALAVTGIIVLGLMLLVAPQCLRSPLSDLDPLLQTYWISTITEAQSLVAELAIDPKNIGAFYAVGIIAAAVCLMRIARRDRVMAHAVLLGLIVVSWLVSAVQVRGMLFANYLAFIPLSALVADLRALYLSRRNDGRTAAAFALAAVLSVPSVWSIVGVIAFDPANALASVRPDDADRPNETGPKICVTAQNIAGLASMPRGRILGGFNEGPALLRFTPHSVLAANYHRNQRGMIAALKIGMTKPQDALPLLEAQNIRYILFCDGDPMVSAFVREYPAGLYAALRKDDIPGYLEALPTDKSSRLRIYEMIQR